eukprot:EG_transcript_10704
MGNASSSPTSTPLPVGEYFDDVLDLAIQIWPVLLTGAVSSYSLSLYGNAERQIKDIFFGGSSAAAWGAFGISVIARPFGGVAFGWMSDRFGRRHTAMGMAYGSLMVVVGQGSIPSNWGPTGTVLLCVLRAFDGVFYGGASSLHVYSLEMCSKRILGGAAMLMQMSFVGGWLVSVLVSSVLMQLLGEQRMLQYGWRLPFFVAVIPGLVAAVLSHTLEETPEFLEAHPEEEQEEGEDQDEDGKDGEEEPGPFHALFTEYRMQVVLFVGVSVSTVACIYVNSTYLLEWLPEVAGLDATQSFWIVTLHAATAFTAAPAMAWMTDRFGASKVLLYGMGTGFLATIPIFSVVVYLPYQQWTCIGLSIINGTLYSLCTPGLLFRVGLFPVEFRSTAVGLVFNLTASIFGALAPLNLTWLTDVVPLAPAYYLTFCFLCSLVAVKSAIHLRAKGLPVSHFRDEPF